MWRRRLGLRGIVGPGSRDQVLATGDVRMHHTTEPWSLVELRAKARTDQVVHADDNAVDEEEMVLLNTLAPPLDGLLARRALVRATDLES